MWRSVKRGRRGRLRHSRPIICSTPESEALPPANNLRDEVDPNESTQAVGGADVQECNQAAQGGEGNINTDPPIQKRGRGTARGTLFERLRKVGKIPLDIKDGHRGPSCENASIFTGQVTWIVKVYADMRHESWSYVPEEEKQELVDRVRADFVLDWGKDNHREMVVLHLSDKYNAYHYELHKIYQKYGSHEEAMRGGTPMVEKPVWELLCERWASKTFKNIMVERLNEKDPDEDYEEAAADIVKDVLGFKSGYAQGMGHMVIPDPSPSMKKNKAYMRLAEENERNKGEAEMYKARLDQMMADIVAMRRNFSEYEKEMNFRVSELEQNTESHRETQQDA
ncbi:uncharacterized protein LOC109007460 [Juglans regia]|uniref:Uncharacterized protein LOC109007460 n=1 Tax=Juglans regia TaxID=51240 RepID=A0A6P9E3K2_JUGRE|nr:uncharacterized protein LOC109007460 [Juglans regia]